MAVERRLTELVGDAGAKLHTGRSRNDQVVTDVRLHLRRVIEGQRDGAARAAGRCWSSAPATTSRRCMPAYTHLQRAQVTSLAHHLLAWFWMLERDRARLRGRPRGLPRAAARRRRGGRPQLRPRPRRRGRRAGLRRVVAENSLDAVADRDFVVDYLAAAAQLGVHISPLGAELVLWATRRVRLRAPARRLQRRLEHHAAEEEPRRRRAHARRRAAAGRRPRRPARRAPRPAARLQHRPARGQALPVRRRRLPRPAAAGRARPARGARVRQRAHGGRLRPFLWRPTSPTRWSPRACRSARRTTSTGALVRRCLERGVGARRRSAPKRSRAGGRSSPARLSRGIVDRARSLAAKVSAAARRPERVREQLALARERSSPARCG